MLGDPPPEEKGLELTPLPPSSQPAPVTRSSINRYNDFPLPPKEIEPPKTVDPAAVRRRDYDLPLCFLIAGGLFDFIVKCILYRDLVAAVFHFASDLVGNTALLLVATALMVWLRGLRPGPYRTVVFKLAAIVVVLTAMQDLLRFMPGGFFGAGLVGLAIEFVLCRSMLRLLFIVNDEDSWIWTAIYCLIAALWQWQTIARGMRMLVQLLRSVMH